VASALRQVIDPNEVVNHYPPACSMGGVRRVGSGADKRCSLQLFGIML
jgi:hypothetical protein